MKNVLFILLAFTFLSCYNDDTTTEPTVQTGPIAFVNIHQDHLGVPNPTGIIQPSNLVIDTIADWNNLLGQLSPAINPVATNIIAQANINFNQETVIVVIREVFPTIQSVEITEVMENVNNITVTAIDSNNINGFTAISQPYHIVRIPKTTKPIVFL